MSSPPVLPDQPAKARYATPSVPAAMEAGGPTNDARYTGGTSIWTLGPQYGAAGAAAADGMRNASIAIAKNALTTPIGNVRTTKCAGGWPTPSTAAESSGFRGSRPTI